jgi:hypothetical protein
LPQAPSPAPDADPRETRPTVPLARLFLLTIVTAALALAAQALLAATDAPAAGVLIRLIVPLGAAAVLYLGLRPYPAAGRARLGLMVAAALFLIGLSL